MNFSIAAITCRLLAPRHELSCSWWLWRRLLAKLRERGRGAARRAVRFCSAARMPPAAGASSISRSTTMSIRTRSTPASSISTVATSASCGISAAPARSPSSPMSTPIPAASGQSDSDRAHPIIARAGHLALIVPNFAAPPVMRRRARHLSLRRRRKLGNDPTRPSSPILSHRTLGETSHERLQRPRKLCIASSSRPWTAAPSPVSPKRKVFSAVTVSASRSAPRKPGNARIRSPC